MVDGEFALTRVRDMKRVAETLWCGSGLGVCNQLRKWNVNDNGIHSIELQLTKTVIASVRTDSSLG